MLKIKLSLSICLVILTKHYRPQTSSRLCAIFRFPAGTINLSTKAHAHTKSQQKVRRLNIKSVSLLKLISHSSYYLDVYFDYNFDTN